MKVAASLKPQINLTSGLVDSFGRAVTYVRLSVTGKLYLCLGRKDEADLRAVLRSDGDLRAALTKAMTRKPKAHDFLIETSGQAPAFARHMSMTGG